MITLFSAQTTNANGTTFAVATPEDTNGDKVVDAILVVNGTFTTGSVTLEASVDGGTVYNTISTAALTAAGVQNLKVSGGMKVRAVLDAGTGESINAYLMGVATDNTVTQN